MTAGAPLPVVVAAAQRLRRLPEARWRQAPRLPLGSRAPHVVPSQTGASVEAQIRGVIAALMAEDASARGVAAFPPAVPVYGLPDVLIALARSVAQRDPESPALAAAAAASAGW